MNDQPSNKAGSPACCSPASSERFDQALRELPEPAFRRALQVIGELVGAYPQASRACHRRLFLLVVDALSVAQSSNAATGT